MNYEGNEMDQGLGREDITPDWSAANSSASLTALVRQAVRQMLEEQKLSNN